MGAGSNFASARLAAAGAGGTVPHAASMGSKAKQIQTSLVVTMIRTQHGSARLQSHIDSSLV